MRKNWKRRWMIIRVGRGPDGADGAWLTYYDRFENGVLGTFLGVVDLNEVRALSPQSDLGPGIFEVDTAGAKPRVYYLRPDDGAPEPAERDAWLAAIRDAAKAGRARAASQQQNTSLEI